VFVGRFTVRRGRGVSSIYSSTTKDEYEAELARDCLLHLLGKCKGFHHPELTFEDKWEKIGERQRCQIMNSFKKNGVETIGGDMAVGIKGLYEEDKERLNGNMLLQLPDLEGRVLFVPHIGSGSIYVTLMKMCTKLGASRPIVSILSDSDLGEMVELSDTGRVEIRKGHWVEVIEDADSASVVLLDLTDFDVEIAGVLSVCGEMEAKGVKFIIAMKNERVKKGLNKTGYVKRVTGDNVIFRNFRIDGEDGTIEETS
jgi:hypothetical protein